ncbi:MAG TPA: NDP-sugar synthase [Candidatus Dormibacteraeota bacterium]
MAAGRGERLGALTDKTPKPLLELAGEAILDRNLAWLAASGVDDVAINLHYLGEVIRHHVESRPHPRMSIVFSPEEKALGTAGGAKRAASLLPVSWPLLVIYADNLVQLDIQRLVQEHKTRRADATIAVYPVTDARLSGLVEFEANGAVRSFVEKPQSPSPVPGWVNAGVYAIEEAVLRVVPEGRASDFGFDVFPRLVMDGARIGAYPLTGDESIFPIDTAERYEESQRAMAARLQQRRERRDQA